MPGLYFLGLPWQYTRGSALLGWVKDDAQFIAEQIAANDEPTEVTAAGGTVITGGHPIRVLRLSPAGARHVAG